MCIWRRVQRKNDTTLFGFTLYNLEVETRSLSSSNKALPILRGYIAIFAIVEVEFELLREIELTLLNGDMLQKCITHVQRRRGDNIIILRRECGTTKQSD